MAMVTVPAKVTDYEQNLALSWWLPWSQPGSPAAERGRQSAVEQMQAAGRVAAVAVVDVVGVEMTVRAMISNQTAG